MKDEILDLLSAVEEFKRASNALWDAENPSEDKDMGNNPMPLERAREQHRDAFRRFQKAVHVMLGCLDPEDVS